MAGKDSYQGRFHHAAGSLFAGDNEDLEICVERLTSTDLTIKPVTQGREKAK